jgi:hypothetical protein
MLCNDSRILKISIVSDSVKIFNPKLGFEECHYVMRQNIKKVRIIYSRLLIGKISNPRNFMK